MPNTEIKIMKIGSGKTTTNGVKVKVRGYAPRVGKSLAELLKEHKEVKLLAMGDAPCNNLLKAIAHAQNLLNEEERDLIADKFAFEPAELVNSDGSVGVGKLVSVLVKLV